MAFEKQENIKIKTKEIKRGEKYVIVCAYHDVFGRKREMVIDKETGKLLETTIFSSLGNLTTSEEVIDMLAKKLKIHPTDLSSVLDRYLTSSALKEFFKRHRKNFGNKEGAIVGPPLQFFNEHSKEKLS